MVPYRMSIITTIWVSLFNPR